MATSSFFDTYYITEDNVGRFIEIMNSEKHELILDEIPDCENLEGKDIIDFLGLEEYGI
ncbi:MAG: hypothetical protein LUG60_05510 [Erysipelotrichaceae bacterium]|nr:hypothetical protein [Erysipelotrichaceae bacterium]